MTAGDRRQRLGELVRARRIELGLSISDAAAAAEMNRNTWKAMEDGARATRDASYASIDRTLRWRVGSTAGILEGREPKPGFDPEEVVDWLLSSATDVERDMIGRLLRATTLPPTLNGKPVEERMRIVDAVSDPLFTKIGMALVDENLPDDLRQHLRRGVERAYEAWLQWVKTLGQEPASTGREQVGR